MTEFEFNCMTEGNHLMHLAKLQHRIDVAEAYARQDQRAAAREYRKVRREKRLNTALLVASMIGIAVSVLSLASIVAV